MEIPIYTTHMEKVQRVLDTVKRSLHKMKSGTGKLQHSIIGF